MIFVSSSKRDVQVNTCGSQCSVVATIIGFIYFTQSGEEWWRMVNWNRTIHIRELNIFLETVNKKWKKLQANSQHNERESIAK